MTAQPAESMYPIIASDDPSIAADLRDALFQLGHDCRQGNVLSIDDAARQLQRTDRQPDLVLFVLPNNERRFLEKLAQFREATRARIIAIGDGNDAEHVLATVHAGADDYVVNSKDLYEQLASFLVRLTVKRQSGTPKGRVTIVASAGGGCGTSVIASNLAVLIAKQRESCGLFDFDAYGGDQSALLNLKPRHTLDELCRNIDECDANLLEHSLTHHESGVQLLPAPQRISENRFVTPEALRIIARIGRSVLEDLVIDAGSVCDGGDPELLRMADRILLVFRCDVPGSRRLRMILESWDEHELNTDNVHFVANRCGQAKKLPVAKIEAALRKEVALCLTDDRRKVNLSVDCGNPIVLESPRATFAKSMVTLGQRVGLLTAG